MSGREEERRRCAYPVSRLPGSSSGCYTIESIESIRRLTDPSSPAGKRNGLTGALQPSAQLRFWNTVGWLALFFPFFSSHVVSLGADSHSDAESLHINDGVRVFHEAGPEGSLGAS